MADQLPAAPSARSSRKASADRLNADAWIKAGRQALIEGGVGAVRVERLAAKLGVTTGSFYWHFKDRPALLDALVADWKATNTEPFFQAVAEAGEDPRDQFAAMSGVWIEEKGYSSAWDSAMRDWARTSPEVEAVVREVDERRIALLKTMFDKAGYEDLEAFVRARVAYFHQVGYYAMRIVEDVETRRKLRPVYGRALGMAPDR